jgi:hypothetical protein
LSLNLVDIGNVYQIEELISMINDLNLKKYIKWED